MVNKMEDFSEIINWENVEKQKENFHNSKPFKFAFVEDFFKKDFYDKLYETYPKIDDSWTPSTHMAKNIFMKNWSTTDAGFVVQKGDDPSFSKEWNKFKRYAESPEYSWFSIGVLYLIPLLVLLLISVPILVLAHNKITEMQLANVEPEVDDSL